MIDILILTASFGMGHKSVSNALKEQLETGSNNTKTVIADIFEIVGPNVKNFGSKLYYQLTENYPLVYNTIYDIKKTNKNNIIDEVFCNLYYKKIYSYILVEKPKVIISTFPLCSCIVSKIKEEYNANINLITVITDVVDSWEWIYNKTNIYLVPSMGIKNKLINKGVCENTIIVTGIPVKKEFLHSNINFALSQKKSILLVLSGVDYLPEEVLAKLNNNNYFKAIIVTGRNEKLYKELSKTMYSNIKIYGFVNNLDKLMDEAAFIITKPGGVTLFEAINKELPLIILNSNIGQEKGNIEFIKQNKIGMVIDDVNNLSSILDYCIGNPKLIQYYCNNIRKIKKTLHYKEVIDYVLNEVI
ncbi:MAG: glycosyltransferase [Sedimentibacter sp.]